LESEEFGQIDDKNGFNPSSPLEKMQNQAFIPIDKIDGKDADKAKPPANSLANSEERQDMK